MILNPPKDDLLGCGIARRRWFSSSQFADQLTHLHRFRPGAHGTGNRLSDNHACNVSHFPLPQFKEVPFPTAASAAPNSASPAQADEKNGVVIAMLKVAKLMGHDVFDAGTRRANQIGVQCHAAGLRKATPPRLHRK